MQRPRCLFGRAAQAARPHSLRWNLHGGQNACFRRTGDPACNLPQTASPAGGAAARPARKSGAVGQPGKGGRARAGDATGKGAGGVHWGEGDGRGTGVGTKWAAGSKLRRPAPQRRNGVRSGQSAAAARLAPRKPRSEAPRSPLDDGRPLAAPSGGAAAARARVGGMLGMGVGGGGDGPAVGDLVLDEVGRDDGRAGAAVSLEMSP